MAAAAERKGVGQQDAKFHVCSICPNYDNCVCDENWMMMMMMMTKEAEKKADDGNEVKGDEEEEEEKEEKNKPKTRKESE